MRVDEGQALRYVFLPGVARTGDVKCVIPGCRREGIWQLGVRARLIAGATSPSHPTKKATDAAFAPNLPAFLCDKHAFSGCLVTVIVEPRSYRQTRVRAIGAPNPQPHRTVKIQ